MLGRIEPQLGPDPLVPVRARWQEASASAGWTGFEDWWHPSVDAFVDAVCGLGGDPLATAERLGRERAWRGIGLTEALSDLRVGMDVLDVSPSDHADLAGALAAGWADAIVSWLGRSGHSCRDTLTELATREYLSTRLRELYAECAAEGRELPAERVLIVVSVRADASPLVTEQRMVNLGQVLATVFTRGQTLARVGPGVAVALVRRDGALNDVLLSLQLELAWAGMTTAPVHARTWFEPLPPRFVHVSDLLEDLVRL